MGQHTPNTPTQTQKNKEQKKIQLFPTTLLGKNPNEKVQNKWLVVSLEIKADKLIAIFISFCGYAGNSQNFKFMLCRTYNSGLAASFYSLLNKQRFSESNQVPTEYFKIKYSFPHKMNELQLCPSTTPNTNEKKRKEVHIFFLNLQKRNISLFSKYLDFSFYLIPIIFILEEIERIEIILNVGNI